jgi:outer membrane receptor protein involved in Fe transport
MLAQLSRLARFMIVFVGCGAACLLIAPAVHADDVADEADLQFQIGAERYRAGDFRGALEHFLASNRLAPNRNVSFNIARSYEQLKSYPEAFRYYSQALEGESDAETRHRVERALEGVRPNVALLRVVTHPPGAQIYIERRELGARGVSPRQLALAPGRYRVLAELPEHEPAEAAEIEVRAADETLVELTLLPKFAAQSGDLVVSTDELGALVEVDGRPRAFTPAILTLAGGEHTLRVSSAGFRTVEQSFEIKPKAQTKLDIELTRTEEVNAASRVSEAIEDAPSSVSVVTTAELRGMAYPTIAEAVRGVRGVYVSDDRSYATVGFRGLSPLGLYGNRVLVLLDGQPTNDDWIGSSYVGYDARTDLEDVARIEVVRGPGSVLYGTNAVSGVINLVTRDVSTKSSGEVSVGSQEYGLARARARANLRLSSDATVWTSVAAAMGSGRDFYFKEFALEPGAGNARDLDGFRSATVNGRFTWRAFTAQWFLNSRNKQLPTAQFRTRFGDPNLQQVDTRALLELRFEPAVSRSLQLLSRAHLNYYNFRGHYPYEPVEGGVQVDTYNGSWVGFEQRAVFTPLPGVRLTAGAEAQLHWAVHQTSENNSGSRLDDKQPYQVLAGYALADLALSPAISLSGGARVDRYSTFGSSINPRLALIARPYAAGNLKLMAGKAFRAPSVYELSYNDGGATQVPSPGLRPESIYSVELEFSHRWSPTLTTTAAIFGNLARDLITQRGAGVPDDPLHYENSSAAVWIVGGEVEARREWRQGWMVSASYSAQHARYLPGAALAQIVGRADDVALRRVPNAPEHLAAFRAAAPVFGRALLASTRVAVEGPRFDRYDRVSDAEPQRSTDPAAVWDLVLSGQEPRWKLQYALGLYNVFDWRYNLPLSREFAPRSIAQNGRTLLVSVGSNF